MSKKRKAQKNAESPPPTGVGIGSPAVPAASDGRLARGKPRWGIVALVVVVIGISVFAVFQLLDPKSRGDTTTQPIATPGPVAQHVGRAVCAECHAREVVAWKGSDHDLAMQVVDAETILGDFANAKFTYAGTTTTFSRRDGKYIVNTDGPDGKLADFEIKYVFGVRPLQQYLIELPGGRMQALSIAYDTRPRAAGGQRWFHLYPGQNIKAGDWLHWTAGGQNWNYTCAECHSTNLRKNFDPKTETYNTTWSELNVSCESCHGPGSSHVGWAKKQGDWKSLDPSKGLAIALDERRGVQWTPIAATGNSQRSHSRTSNREIETCARCHGRAGRFSDDYVHGKSPLDTHRLARLDAGLYWQDGQQRDEVYNWGSFVQSKMHAKGVTCSDCHDPHSLKLKLPGNAVCAQCHLPSRFDNEQHTHHQAGTPGAACASCHMPTATYMVVDPRHDHSMRIPRPDVSVKTGAPNACTNCHARQTAQWAAAAIQQWTGKLPAGFQQFATAFADAATGAPGARGALLALIDDKAQPPLVRASAIDRLRPWMTPAMLPAVSRALNDGDASVRLAAVENLGASEQDTRLRYLPRMLGDPVRSVRMEAARALAGPAEANLSTEDRNRFATALDEYIAAQRYIADRPEGHANLAGLYASRGDAEAAIAGYRRAIALDPAFVPAYVNLADLYRARGVDAEAESVLRAGIVKAPSAAALHHSLALVLVRQKRTPEALKALAESVRLEPASARYAYVRAVALYDSGQPREAIRVLESALKKQPHDRDLLSALALYGAQGGSIDAARGYASRLVELDPENAEYAALAKRLAETQKR